MSQTIDIKIPDLGDFSDVDVIEVLVKAGDEVKREQGLVTLETDKASMDVPAADRGTIEELTVAVGDKVSTGDVIGRLKVEVGDTVVVTPAIEANLGQGDTTVVASPDADESATSGKHTLSVPDIGDFTDVDVIEVHIASGDEIAVDDPLITLETDKAAMDVPAVLAGTVEKLLVQVGDTVSEGSPIAIVQAIESTPDTAQELRQPSRQREVLQAVEAKPEGPASPPKAGGRLPPIDEAGFSKAHASPSVRKLARELGVNLIDVKGSGPKSRILHDDVKAYVKAILTGKMEIGAGIPKVPAVDFAKFGKVETVPLTRIQKISGPRLQASWLNIPHVTQHDLADVTRMERHRQELKASAKERGFSLTPLAFILKACIATLREFPRANSSLSEDGTSLIRKNYYHIGFAADTEDGLMVPVIHDADRMNVFELARSLAKLSSAAREGKLKADQVQGASFTVSSLGGIGGTAFTPIINAPEVAILGVSRSSMQPVWNGKKFLQRLMLPLSLSYDHRVIDGAYAVRFTTFLGEVLRDMDVLLEGLD
jgi:pyruvate dehydrogenase E2 component (dihydrolipoamide acetyltransferase)